MHVDQIAIGETEVDQIFLVDEDNMATLLDTAIAVIEAVDGGVELVVTAQRLQHQTPGRYFKILQGVRGQHGLADRGVEGARVPRPVRQHESALLPDAFVIVLKSLDHVGDVVTDTVVVGLESGPVDRDRVSEHSAGQSRNNRDLREQVWCDRLELSPRRMHRADRVLHGDKLHPAGLLVDFGAPQGR